MIEIKQCRDYFNMVWNSNGFFATLKPLDLVVSFLNPNVFTVLDNWLG